MTHQGHTVTATISKCLQCNACLCYRLNEHKKAAVLVFDCRHAVAWQHVRPFIEIKFTDCQPEKVQQQTDNIDPTRNLSKVLHLLPLRLTIQKYWVFVQQESSVIEGDTGADLNFDGEIS